MEMRFTNVIALEKMNYLFFVFLLFFSFLTSNYIYPQTEYSVSLTNAKKINKNILEFEVIIFSSNEIVGVTSYQCSFLFNTNIIDGGRLVFSYVEGSSQLSNLPNIGIGIKKIDGKTKLTFASGAGLDYIGEFKLRIGIFRLYNTVPFSNADPNFTWNFSGPAMTILTGEAYENITVPANFFIVPSEPSITGLHRDNQNFVIPNELKLLQNYPNPFNPNTKISFQLIDEADVKLEIYNSLGQQVSIPLDEHRSPGIHTVDFNGESLPSGIYFYKLKANDKLVGSMKMILLR